MGRMKVALMTEVGKIEMVERDIPVTKDDEILVKIKHCGICGSDVHYYEKGRIGNFVVTKPIVLGHECSGEVVQVGKDVMHFKVNDLVAIEPGVPCGHCEFCRKGLYNLCPDVVFLATPPYDGAFCEYIAYPARMAFQLPRGMDTMEGALIEPLAVGFHAMMQSNAKVGQSAVILGAGCIGLCTLLALRAAGVSHIYVVDVIERRLEMAKKLGASEIIHAKNTNVKDYIDSVTNGAGLDLVFETAGAMATTQLTPSLVKRGGMILLVGMTSEGIVSYDLGTVLSKEASIHTVFRYRNMYETAINAVVSSKLPLKDIVTSVFPFDKVQEAIEYNIHNKSETVKVVIEM